MKKLEKSHLLFLIMEAKIRAAFDTLKSELLRTQNVKESLKTVMRKHGYEMFWGVNRWIKINCLK